MKQKKQLEKVPVFDLNDDIVDGSGSIYPSERICWYSQLLNALILCNEKEDSREYKEFITDKETTQDFVRMIDDYVRSDAYNLMSAIPADYPNGLAHFLKTYKDALTKVATTRIEQIINDYITKVDNNPIESSIIENPLSFHANMLHELIDLPSGLNEDQANNALKAIDYAAECLIEAYQIYEQEVNDPALTSMRCVWLSMLFLEHKEMICFVIGQWRLQKMLDHLSNARELLPAPSHGMESPKERQMFIDIMTMATHNNVISGLDDSDNDSDCGCCNDKESECDCCD